MDESHIERGPCCFGGVSVMPGVSSESPAGLQVPEPGTRSGMGLRPVKPMNSPVAPHHQAFGTDLLEVTHGRSLVTGGRRRFISLSTRPLYAAVRVDRSELCPLPTGHPLSR